MDFIEAILSIFDSSEVPDASVPDTDIASDTVADFGLDDSGVNDLGDTIDAGDYSLSDDASGDCSNISFQHRPPDADADGYIRSGNVRLERSASGDTDTFTLYKKDGHSYVFEDGRFKQIDGTGTVNINNIKYEKK